MGEQTSTIIRDHSSKTWNNACRPLWRGEESNIDLLEEVSGITFRSTVQRSKIESEGVVLFSLTLVSRRDNQLQEKIFQAIRAQEMYGEVDQLSGEWITGVFAAMWEKFNNRENSYNTWLVCDGPVDAIWIEVVRNFYFCIFLKVDYIC